MARRSPTRGRNRGEARLSYAMGIGLALQPIPFIPVVTLAWGALLPALWRGLTVRVKRIAALVALSAASTVATDLLVGTPRTVMLKTLAQSVAFAVFFLVYSSLAIHLDNQTLIAAAGFAGLGWAIAAVLFSPHVEGYSQWKYYVASPVGLIAAALAAEAWLAGRRALSYVVMLGFAVVLGVTGFRSYAVVFLLAALATAGAASSRVRRKWSARRIAVTAAAVLAAAYLFSFAANLGLFGAATKTKWRAEGASPVGVLFAARPEFAVSAALVPHHLGRGLGSEGRIGAEEYGVVADRARVEHPAERAALVDRLTRAGLDVHSAMFQRWLQGGLPAAAAFLAILWFCGVYLVRASPVDIAPWGPLVMFMAVALAWDMLFSPWTYFVGPIWGMYAAFVCAVRPDSPP
jgi:hypothetical protein